jgi:hypothetical protein
MKLFYTQSMLMISMKEVYPIHLILMDWKIKWKENSDQAILMVWNYRKTFEIIPQMLFWRKDFQQLQIVKKMVKTNLKVNAVGCPISESNQLASEFQE